MSEAGRLVHDAVWAVALAFNYSLSSVGEADFKAELFNLTFMGASVSHTALTI